ncbi:hypothetical protein [Falsirhodobacter halotolerans]|uniref:hypothetical protein n=1 Tax=Falsirhodobacter halotolerans TaxID=1146892 RepID=UPI001FD09811|nr:hypothetical protein [Falsirhodobacter halotolerans]MCJ8139570.1 hypothetical protein [Falsirhodobacter halotolerans]
MATKKTDTKTEAPADEANATGIADPAPATTLEDASGAIIEPSITGDVDVSHESIDANPRAGTTAAQNQIDMNDPARRTPNDVDFAGLGLDPTPYGKKAK